MFFSCLNQRYDIIICVYWFEMFSQVSDVAHGPLDFFIMQEFSLAKYMKYRQNVNIVIISTVRLTFRQTRTLLYVEPLVLFLQTNF